MKSLWSDFCATVRGSVVLYFYPLTWLWQKIRGTKLNRCLTCGGKGMVLDQNPFKNRYQVHCKDCGKTGKSSCVKEVAKLQWNIENDNH